MQRAGIAGTGRPGGLASESIPGEAVGRVVESAGRRGHRARRVVGAPAERASSARSERFIVGGSAVTAFVPLAASSRCSSCSSSRRSRRSATTAGTSSPARSWNPGSTYSAADPHRRRPPPRPARATARWPLILGTLETSAIALVIGFPIAVGAAVLHRREAADARSPGVIGLCLEILAGIPSVVFGLWGVFTFGPWLAAQHLSGARPPAERAGAQHLPGELPATARACSPAGIVLAAMIVPLIAATTRDLLRQVPEATKEGAEALGMTSTEVFRTVQLRWVRTGVIGAAVLGLGRALGETIAIALVTGSVLDRADEHLRRR